MTLTLPLLAANLSKTDDYYFKHFLTEYFKLTSLVYLELINNSA